MLAGFFASLRARDFLASGAEIEAMVEKAGKSAKFLFWAAVSKVNRFAGELTRL